MEEEFSLEKEHVVKIVHRIVAGIKNRKTAAWSSVHLVTGPDGAFGLNGDTVTGKILNRNSSTRRPRVKPIRFLESA